MLTFVEVSNTEYGLETKNMNNQRRKHGTQHNNFHYMVVIAKISKTEN